MGKNIELDEIFISSGLNSKKIVIEEPEASQILAYKISRDNSQVFTKEEQEKIVMTVVLPKGKTLSYIVKKGETIEIIAKKLGVKKSDILALNNLSNKDFIREGQKLLIPASKVPIKGKINTQITLRPIFVSALSSVGNIIVPVSGINQRRIHSNNGIDISAECGSPVYSADSGIVIESSDGWNGGYGNYIVIQHKNYETLYGHLSQRYVEVGDYVEKGSLIGTVGATGKATGCHLHFETRGIKNPLGN